MSGRQAVAVPWPLAGSRANVRAFVRETPLKFVKRVAFDDLLEELIWGELNVIEYGEPHTAGRYVPVIRICFGQTSCGIRFAFNVLNFGRDAEVVLFHLHQRDQLEAKMEQVIAGYWSRGPRIVPSANQSPIAPAVMSRWRSPLLAVAYLALEERRRDRSRPQPGGARQEDRPGCLTLPLPGVRMRLPEVFRAQA